MSEKKFGTIITNEGAALIAECILAGKTLPIVEAAAGDGGGAYYEPTADQTALKGERWRGEIAGFALSEYSPNMIDVKIVIDDAVGGFTVREMGLFTDDGILFAVCNTPDTEKVSITGGIPGRLTMTMHIIVTDASVVKVVINPGTYITVEQFNAIKEKIERLQTDVREIGCNIRKEIAKRLRDPGKPDYGVGGGGEAAGVTLITAEHTGSADVTVVINGKDYDGKNISRRAEDAPSGTIIIKEEN